jgi:LPPG:FO 2-phospho-L-lactate transferase
LKVVALAGGTGSAKLLLGLSDLGPDLTVIANVGDNAWMHGLYVCPDVDIALYTLAGIADEARGWGVKGDTFESLAQLKRLGAETWFALGDRDLATHIRRTELLGHGMSLTEATDDLRNKLHVASRVLPATDDPVETQIRTPRGLLHLQEFWVRERGRPRVTGVTYRGSRRAKPTEDVVHAVQRADRVIVCPANPVTSIGPTLAIPGFIGVLERSGVRSTALSPMLGSAPFSGPALKLMKAVGLRPDSLGVAERYSSFLDAIVIDRSDGRLAAGIQDLGLECRLSDTRISSVGDARRLARELLEV